MRTPCNETVSTESFPSTLVEMKSTLCELISSTPRSKICLVAIEGDAHNKCVADTLFISNGVRHSRETNSLVLDGWSVNDQMGRSCAEFVRFDAPVYYVTPSEHILWKRTMPSSVESCRRNWIHKASCEYRNAQAPLSTEPWASLICKCGEGKDVEDFPGDELTKLFQNWPMRITLPLLPAVSYVEAMDPPGPRQMFSF